MLAITAFVLNNRASAADQLDQQYNQRHNQQDVDVPPDRVKTHQTHQPQNQQDYEDCPKHLCFSFVLACGPKQPTV